MWKVPIALIVFALLAIGATAQSTTVSGTITDANGQAYANGAYRIEFFPNGVHGPYIWNGSPFVPTPFTGSLNGSGAFSGVSVPSNNYITGQSSGSTQWRFTVCPVSKSPCFSLPLTVQGSTQSVSSSITPPGITVNANAPVVDAYPDSEVDGGRSGGVSLASGASNQVALKPATGSTVVSLPSPTHLPGALIGPGVRGQVCVDGTTYTTVQGAMTAAGSDGQTCVPPTYTGTDQPNGTRVAILFTPVISTQSLGAHLIDNRYGGIAESFFNPTYDGISAEWTAQQEICNWSEVINHTANTACRLEQSNTLSGTQNVDVNGYTNKTNVQQHVWQNNSWAAAQVNADSFEAYCYGDGDCQSATGGATDYGGAITGSDEGLHVLGFSGTQGVVEYSGTISAGGTTGSTLITVSPTQGSGTQGDRFGAFYDSTTGVCNAGTITSFTGTGLVAVAGSGTGWTTCPNRAASTTTTTTAAITVTNGNLTPGSVNVPVSSATGFSTNNIICVADAVSFEYSKITSVPDGTHITASFLLPHASGATIATGGLCGYGLAMTADTWTASSNGVTPPLRQIWPFVANSSATAATVWISIAGLADNYAGGAALPGAAYHAYPMSIVTDVTNGGPTVSNTITLEPNNVAWTSGDTVSQALTPAFKASIGNTQFTKFFPTQGVAGGGWSFTYNGIWNAPDCLFCLTNTAVTTNYTGWGGHLRAPTGFQTTGPEQYALNVVNFPKSALIAVGCPYNTAGNQDCNVSAQQSILNMNGSCGNDNLLWFANTNSWQFTSDCNVDSLSFSHANGVRLTGAMAIALNGNSTTWNSNGILREYDGLPTVNLGQPVELGTLDQTGVSTAHSGSAQNVLASTPSAGHYRLFYYIDQSAGCKTVGSGGLTISTGWTDATHARASANQKLKPGTVDTGTSSYLSNSIDFWAAAGTAVTVTATYTGCTTGTWTYDLHSYVEELK